GGGGVVAVPAGRLAGPAVAGLLGVCEHAAGHHERALELWAGIPFDVPNGVTAALLRARTLVGDLGRFSEAEALLEALLPHARSARLEVRHMLSQLYFWESRKDAMRRVYRGGSWEWQTPAEELRDLWLIDHATVHSPMVRAEIEAAERRAPDDHRVLLARAGLDTLEGRFDAARRRLDDCLRRRPDDPVVWSARLRLARSEMDVAEVE